MKTLPTAAEAREMSGRKTAYEREMENIIDYIHETSLLFSDRWIMLSNISMMSEQELVSKGYKVDRRMGSIIISW